MSGILWGWVMAALVVAVSPTLIGQEPPPGPPRRAIGAAAYPEFVKLSAFFVARPLVDVPRSYRIAAKFTGTDAPASPFYIGESSAAALVRAATCEADLVAFAVAREPAVFLSANDRWVFSEHVLDALEVVPHKRVGGGSPKTIKLILPVGDLRVAGQRVSTEVSRYPRLRAGQRYVFFLRRTEEELTFRTVNRLPLLRIHSPARFAPVSGDYDAALFAGRAVSELTDWIRTAECRP